MLGTGVTLFTYRRGSVMRNRRGYWLPRRKCWLQVVTRHATIGLVFVPSVGYLLTRVVYRDGRTVHEVPPPDRRKARVKKIKLFDPTTQEVQHLAAMENNYWASELQPVVAFLARTRYDDGTARVPGELRLKTRGAAWECQLIDHDSRAHVRLVSSSLDDVLAMVVLGLETEEMPWELADWLPKPRGKR